MNPKELQLPDRTARVAFMREREGMTFKRIGEVLNVCGGRARDIYRQAVRLREYHAKGIDGNAYYGLSPRAANCLNNAGLLTRDQILAAAKTGKFDPRRKAPRNLGWKTYIEIFHWLGLPPPTKGSGVWYTITCPHCGGTFDRS